MDFKKWISESKEIDNALRRFSEIFSISTWIASPNIDEVERVSNLWGEKKAKSELQRVGFLKKRCLPERIAIRKEALEKKEGVVRLCPLRLLIFTVPIYYKGELVGFFEGDGAKSREFDKEYEKFIEDLAAKEGFHADIVKECASAGTPKKADDLLSIAGIMTDMVELYLESRNRLEIFSSAISEVSNNIRKVAKNLQVLGINISIESARLGESGAGISVISQEIKKVGDFVFEQMNLVNNHLKMVKG